jgi:hypothetical protein
MVCLQCHTPNFRDYKYCRECGTRLEPTDGASALDDSAEVEALLQHAFSQLEQGEATKAMGTVQAALAHDPESPSAHAALGLVYERQGMISEAIHQFRVVLKLNPDSAGDREKLQQLLARSGQERRTGGITPARLAIGSAVAAGLLTFGVGLAVAKGNEKGGRRVEMGQMPIGLPVQRPNSASKALPQTAILKPAFTPAPAPVTSAPLSTGSPGASTVSMVYQPSVGPKPTNATPPPPWQLRKPQATSPNGLAPARIGDVVPLTRPDLTPYPAGGDKPQLTNTPHPVESRPHRTEPLEPDTGFIKIEPVDKPASAQSATSNPGGGSPANPAPPAGDPARPSISITISPGGR